MGDRYPEAIESKLRVHFANRSLAREIFDACVDAMPLEPSYEWRDGVLRLRRWYPCIEVFPEEDGLRLHLELYSRRKHPRLEFVAPSGWHALFLRSRDELDAEAIGWIGEAIQIGNMK